MDTLPKRPLESWGKFRWQDELVSLLWLYNRTGDDRLLALAHLLKQQGWDWRAQFENFPFTRKSERSDFGFVPFDQMFWLYALRDKALAAHGVNIAMGLKQSALWSLVSHDTADREALRHQLAVLDRYHGLPIGLFSADEHLAGRNPSQGVELCTVVEMLYSLEQAFAVTGDAALADRIERIAFNALPAAFTDDMWAHQYDQQPNQIACRHSDGPWTTNGPESNLFGLEPNYGCCTANFHQGWPKLTASLWMAAAEGGLAAIIYAPCTLAVAAGSTPVRVRVNTDYPFRDAVTIAVDPDAPVRFPLTLRIPGTARAWRIAVNGTAQTAEPKDGFVTLARRWAPGDTVDIAFAFDARTVRGYNDSLSVERGPLVFVLPIAERWEKLRTRGLTADWAVHPESAWNFGLAPDADFALAERPVSAVPFSRKAPPVALATDVRPLPHWTTDGSHAPPPPEPADHRSAGAPQSVSLIPYGAAKLRITAFPALA